ncbi:hypothetical protein PCE1_004205 [Barthelona sp. PCE]
MPRQKLFPTLSRDEPRDLIVLRPLLIDALAEKQKELQEILDELCLVNNSITPGFKTARGNPIEQEREDISDIIAYLSEDIELEEKQFPQLLQEAVELLDSGRTSSGLRTCIRRDPELLEFAKEVGFINEKTVPLVPLKGRVVASQEVESEDEEKDEEKKPKKKSKKRKKRDDEEDEDERFDEVDALDEIRKSKKKSKKSKKKKGKK